MLLKENFKNFVLKDLSDNQKEEILKDEEHEYLFIAFESYGSITSFILTNDNDNKYMDIVSNEETWTGMEYLLNLQEIKNILINDIEFINNYCDKYGYSWIKDNNNFIQNLFISRVKLEYLKSELNKLDYYIKNTFNNDLRGIDLIIDYNNYLEYIDS